ncbi:hypothetical protein CCAX7_54740 [Capsulimonas corticalis]|uniref:Uncharacterized protein n=2 Tax=Capsulimonas corticalis TaxID=2219043 RepID=A0A402D5T2_9BACT|nr:hypothetical protein CCAX7_54740 [Capsulimonas corticalis]
MPLINNWHVDCICDHLEAVTLGHIRDLLINIPPGHMKSLLVSVFWPAWEWIQNPRERSLFSSYAVDLAIRDSVRCRDLITSDWYQEWFEPDWKMKGDQNVKSWFQNDKTGFRFSMSVGGRATGFRGNKIVVDDPLNAKEMHSKATRDECIFWWDKVMPTRINDPRGGKRVVIMQRLHEEDLSGHILAKGGFEHLCLPSEFEPERRSRTFIFSKDNDLNDGEDEMRTEFWSDPRTEHGDLLFPEMFTKQVLSQLKKDLGETDFAGQHQQSPRPAAGIIFKSHWWRYWVPKGLLGKLPPITIVLEDGSFFDSPVIEIPEGFETLLQSWDMSFKDSKGADFVAGQVWAQVKADCFLLDQVCERMDFTATIAAVRAMTEKWPLALAKLVEDKANGPAVISSLKKEIPGLIPIEPEGDKVSRAHAVTPMCESGNVYLPHPALYPWIKVTLDRLTAFPNAAKDDDVDALTQALRRMSKKKRVFKLM